MEYFFEKNRCFVYRGKRVEGAIKKGKMWLIPSDAVKPVDGRFKANKIKV